MPCWVAVSWSRADDVPRQIPLPPQNRLPLHPSHALAGLCCWAWFWVPFPPIRRRIRGIRPAAYCVLFPKSFTDVSARL
jgi:hypothetical protein